jgi:hypothetical protein
MQVRLTRKFCDVLNGFDLRPLSIGQMLETNDPVTAMLVAEGWAEPVDVIDSADQPGRSPRRKLAATTFLR